MTVRADDQDDAGTADFTLEPVRPETDWYQKSTLTRWAEALCSEQSAAGGTEDEETTTWSGGGPPGSPGFSCNPQIPLTAQKGGRFWVFVDQIGLSNDGDSYPGVGIALTAGSALDDGVVETSELLQDEGPVESDSVVFACELEPADSPYYVMPFLADPTAALEEHPLLAYRIYVYADQPFMLGESTCDECKDGGACVCWGLGKFPDNQSESNCVMLQVFNSLKLMEGGLDRQLKYLNTLVPLDKV